MNAAYVAVTQLVDRDVMMAEFKHDMLERDDVWRLVDRADCILDEKMAYGQKIEVTFKDGKRLTAEVKAPRGVDPALTNEEIVEKWRRLTKGVIDDERRDQIEKLCLGLEDLDDVVKLEDLLAGLTKNPIA